MRDEISSSRFPGAPAGLQQLRAHLGELLPAEETETLIGRIHSLLAGSNLQQHAERDELAQLLQSLLTQCRAMTADVESLSSLHNESVSDESAFGGQMKTSISGMREEIINANCPRALEEGLQRALVSLEGNHTALQSREQTRQRSRQEVLNHFSTSLHMIADHTRNRLEQLQNNCMQADVHPLTGLPGPHALQIRLDRECLNALSSGSPLALLAVKLDHCDEPDRDSGENAEASRICWFADAVKSGLRQSDFAAHQDGECLLVVLPGTDAQGARRVAGKLIQLIASRPFPGRAASGITTGSCGIACYWEYDTPPAISTRAKAAMERAQAAGGNQLTDWEDG